MKKIELNDTLLNGITGGKLTEAASKWIENNREEVLARAGAWKSLADIALNYVTNDAKVYDVADLKAALKGYGINVDDLN